MAEAWPFSTFGVGSLGWKLARTRIGGGMSISGRGQVGVVDGGGSWEVDLDETSIATQTERRIWNALILRADAGGAVFEVPYLEEEPVSGTTARFAAAADLGATTAQIQRQGGFSAALALGGPQAFTVVHATEGARLYLIRKITSAGSAGAGGIDTVEFLPALREAVTLNQAIDFNSPRCLMRLEDPNDDAWPVMKAPWTADVGVKLVEAFRQGT